MDGMESFFLFQNPVQRELRMYRIPVAQLSVSWNRIMTDCISQAWWIRAIISIWSWIMYCLIWSWVQCWQLLCWQFFCVLSNRRLWSLSAFRWVFWWQSYWCTSAVWHWIWSHCPDWLLESVCWWITPLLWSKIFTVCVDWVYHLRERRSWEQNRWLVPLHLLHWRPSVYFCRLSLWMVWCGNCLWIWHWPLHIAWWRVFWLRWL